MSKKAYRTDLRERLIKHIELGNKKINTSKIFGIANLVYKAPCSI
jgi:hypothetical protein